MIKPEMIHEVKQTIANEFTNYQGTKISIIEMSHRSKEYSAVHAKAKSQLREFMKIPEDFAILWFQGERLLQYAAICMNLVNSKGKASYLISGPASLQAYEESKKLINSSIAFNLFKPQQADAKKCPFQSQNSIVQEQAIMDPSKLTGQPELLKVDPEASYLFFVDDDEASGIRFNDFPKGRIISECSSCCRHDQHLPASTSRLVTLRVRVCQPASALRPERADPGHCSKEPHKHQKGDSDHVRLQAISGSINRIMTPSIRLSRLTMCTS